MSRRPGAAKAAAERRRSEVATQLGLIPQEAEDLLHALPYSMIPGWAEVVEIVEWFESHGWTRQRPVVSDLCASGIHSFSFSGPCMACGEPFPS